MRDFAPEIFSKVRTLYGVSDPLEGVADLPGAVRALSFALVPPLLSFASIFALSFTPYCAVSCRLVRSLRGTTRLCLGSGAYSRNFGCRTALRFVCFFNGEPRRICGRDRRQASDPRFGICARQKRPAPDHRFIHGSVSVSVGSVRIRIHRRRAYIAFSALI